MNTEKQITLATDKVQELVSGAFTNNGLILVADTELDDRFNYKSSDAGVSANRPKMVIQYTVNGPTPTPAASATLSATPTPVFSHAAFTYDGDGKRVKSAITTNVGTTMTYFVGNYYEVSSAKTHAERG